MKTIHINTWCTDDCTIGRLDFGLFRCFTLELPWKDNEQYISCIPAGEYAAVKYQSYSKGEVILLKDVPNRTLIELHSGNYTSEIEGCSLLGDSIKYLNRDGIPDVTNSVPTLRKLLARLPETFTVSVSRAFNSGCI